MKSPDWLRSKSLWLFAVLYGISLAELALRGRSLQEPLGILVIFGLIFPALALLTCMRTPLPSAPDSPHAGETATLVLLLAYVTGFLAIKGPVLAALLPVDAGARLHDVINTLLKLAAFVAAPLLIYLSRHRVLPGAGRSNTPLARLWLSFAVLGTAMFGVTLMVSDGARDLFSGRFSTAQVITGVLACFAWMLVEAGAVEELLFRWLLQSRIAALSGSQIAGVFLGAIAFGLAHAPGMWLRGAGASEGLGAAPDLVTAIAYCITTQAVVGLMFGVLWARTRSLWLLIALHAVVDAASNSAEFIATWGL